jgi:hypothetical protein
MKNGRSLQPWSPKPLPPLPPRSFPSQKQGESPTTNSFTETIQKCSDVWVLETMLRIITDAALACGFKYYNSRGELLTTTRAVLECLEQEGRVMSSDDSLTPIRD